MLSTTLTLNMDNSIVPTPLRYLGHLRLRLIKPLELCLQTRRQGAEVDTTSPEERWTLRWDFKREGRKCDKQHNRHVTTPERSEHINNTFFKKKKKNGGGWQGGKRKKQDVASRNAST